MRPKRKLFGPITAILLTLGMVPAIAAQSTDTQPVSVDVSSSLCGIDIRPSPLTGASLGAWQWNGLAYEEVDGNKAFVFLEAIFATAPYDGCDLIFAFTGLTDATGQHHIPATSSYFEASTGFELTTPQNPKGWTDRVEDPLPSVYYPLSFTLIAVPSSLPAGTYTGTITVTVSNAI